MLVLGKPSPTKGQNQKAEVVTHLKESWATVLGGKIGA